jgi:hypothetical protein
LIDGVFDGARSIEKSIREYEIKEPTKDIQLCGVCGGDSGECDGC